MFEIMFERWINEHPKLSCAIWFVITIVTIALLYIFRDVLIKFIVILWIICIVVLFYISPRNKKVYSERMRVLNLIFDNYYKLLKSGKNVETTYYEDKLKEFDKISYNEMLYKFWKPVKSFYKDII